MDSEVFASISLLSCLLGEMCFPSFCSLRAADFDCGPCRKLRRPLDTVWLRPLIALPASEWVRDSPP